MRNFLKKFSYITLFFFVITILTKKKLVITKKKLNLDIRKSRSPRKKIEDNYKN